MLRVVSPGLSLSLAADTTAVAKTSDVARRLQQALVEAGQQVTADGVYKAADKAAAAAVLGKTLEQVEAMSLSDLADAVEAATRWPLWAKLLVAGGVSLGAFLIIRWFIRESKNGEEA